MRRMKPVLAALAVGLSLSAMAGAGSELAQVRTVYLLPMGNGFDQYLANQLTIQNVFEVATEPGKADAVFTGQIGPDFERNFEQLYPPAPSPDTPREEAGEETAEETGAGAVKREARVRAGTFGRGRGNVFLVDRHTRTIVWSTYYTPKNTSAQELFKAAERVVNRLKKALSANSGR